MIPNCNDLILYICSVFHRYHECIIYIIIYIYYYGEFSLSYHNSFFKIWWINEFGRLIGKSIVIE